MFRTVMPDSAASCSIVSVLSPSGGASVWAVSAAIPVCKVSLSSVTPATVTSNDVTLSADRVLTGMHTHGTREREMRTIESGMGAKVGLGRRLLRSRTAEAFAGVHGVDGYLEQLNPTWAVHDCRAEVTAVERLTPDSATLKLRANGAWRGHRAGQFIQVAIEIDGARRTRCYSPASAEGTGRELEV